MYAVFLLLPLSLFFLSLLSLKNMIGIPPYLLTNS